MAPHRYEDDGYTVHSSDSFRPRYQRRRSSHQSHNDKDGNRRGGFAKVALGVVFVEVVAACLSVWMRKKDEEREHDRRRHKKRQFEKAKARRRREEDRLERQQEERDRRDAERWANVEVHEVRRIGYGLLEHRARSESSNTQQKIEAPPEWDYNEDRAREDGKRRTQDDNRSRTRSAADVT